MSVDDTHIVGSAEPLTPEQTKARLRALEEWGVDPSLVWASLQETPELRLNRMLGVLALTQELQRAWQQREAQITSGLVQMAKGEANRA